MPAASILYEYTNHNRPLVISSPSYSYRTSDFGNAKLLRTLPHVVMCITDVHTLWLRLMLLEGSLGDHAKLEYDTIPSKTLGTSYGFLVVKPLDGGFPVLLLPIITSQRDRALSVLKKDPPTDAKVTLTRQARFTTLEEWLGEPMCRAIAAAIDVYEEHDLTPPLPI